MAGGPQRCEKHNQVHCMKCWKEKEGVISTSVAGNTGSVRDRLPAAERNQAQQEAPDIISAPAVAPGTFDPPGDIEGFDQGGPPNITQPVIVSPPSARTIFVNRTNNESPEIADFVAAARRHALATKTLKDLLGAIKAAKTEKKGATAEFKKMMNPGRVGVKKPRKAKTSSSVDSKPA